MGEDSQKQNGAEDSEESLGPEGSKNSESTEAKETNSEAENENDNVEPIKGEISELDMFKAEAAEYKEKLLYLAAEHENFKKRMEREKQDLVKFGNERLLSELLVVIDSLELAIKAGAQADGDGTKAMVEGVDMVMQQFLQALSKFGVEKINAEGEKFNPEFHEALTQASAKEKDLEPNTIVEIHQNGYMLNGRLLRPSRVVVAL